MTRDELVNALIDWDLGPCSEAASMLQRDGETIEKLRAALECIGGGEIYPAQVAIAALKENNDVSA